MLDDIPDDRGVDSVISVAQSVSEIDDLRPRDRWLSLLDVIGNMACGFANDFKQPFNGEPEQVIRRICFF